MTEDLRRIVLIPAYEPEEPMLMLLEALKKENMELLVVDDGSGEEWQWIFAKAESCAAVLHHPENRGKGAALKTGYRYIEEHIKKPYTVVTADADGQHTVEDILRLMQAAEEDPDTFFLGSRALKEHVPLRSRIGATVTRLIYRITAGVKIHDTQTGLRASGDRLTGRLLAIEGERYEYEMNTLLAFAREKIPMREVEISTIYLDDNQSSHFSPLKDSFRIYKEILRFAASSLACFALDYGLFLLFSLMDLGLGLSNITARVISAVVNYTVNKRLVFQKNRRDAGGAVGYFLLASCILAGNTLLLKALVTLGMGRFAAKLLTEIFFFALSFLTQKFVIFHRKEAEA